MNKHETKKIEAQRGVVSIFTVIFFSLFIGLLVTSFIAFVLRDQQQALNSDLSRSAYDSAQAGVEDVKRALALYTSACSADPTGTTCMTYKDTLQASPSCTTLSKSPFTTALNLSPNQTDNTSINVDSTTNNGDITQVYTCVRVLLNTPDYLGANSAGQSDVIPLKTDGGVFNSVKFEWFTHDDAGLSANGQFSPKTTIGNLTDEKSWGASSPSILRVELIAYPAAGPITNTNLESNMRTLFLYPVESGTNTAGFNLNAARKSSDSGSYPIVPVHCEKAASVEYACTLTATLDSLGGVTNGAMDNVMFARVTPIYGAKTSYRVSMQNNTSTTNFGGIEPEVDSTGRADTLYRRVVSRLRLDAGALYPEYAVDVKQSFCKDFSVGAIDTDFYAGTCLNN